jgi:hypothetical protein
MRKPKRTATESVQFRVETKAKRRWQKAAARDPALEGKDTDRRLSAFFRVAADQRAAQLAGLQWIPFDQSLWNRQPLPPDRRPVLVELAPRAEELPNSYAVGYLRFACEEEDSPMFVIPGLGGVVVAWCDCLPGFEFRRWYCFGTQSARDDQKIVEAYHARAERLLSEGYDAVGGAHLATTAETEAMKNELLRDRSERSAMALKARP